MALAIGRISRQKMPRNSLGELPRHVVAPDTSIYWSDNYVVIDFETTTLYKGSPLVEGNKLLLSCWESGSLSETGYTFGSEYEQERLLEVIEGADFIVAHNAKFELGWLKRCGLDLRKIVTYDTMLAEYVLTGNTLYMLQLGLDRTCKRRGLERKGDVVSKMIKLGIDTQDIPASWLQKYCEQDVRITHELFKQQLPDIETRGVKHLVYQRNLVTPCLADIEFAGLQLDKEIVDETTEDIEDRYARITAELQDFCDGASPTSPKQLTPYVYETLGFKVPTDHNGRPLLTPKGSRSVAEPVMERLRPQTVKQREFLDKYGEWTALNTEVTKYLRKFRLCCDERGGLLRATFNQCSTRTHRFSSSGLEDKIQLQNLARAYKKFFRARNDGWLIGEIDGAQLEFRIAVHMGRDPVGLKNITTEGFDAHAITASTLGVTRQDAKPFTFKPLYGGSGGTDKQREYFTLFRELYKGVATTQRRWVLECLERKEFTTEYGLTFYFPSTEIKRSGWITNSTNIYNYPIQGFATAEIIPIALVCAWHRMATLRSFLVNTVHDSIIGEIHPDEQEMWHELARVCFIDDTYTLLRRLYNIHLTVPLGAGVIIGESWNVGEETKYEAEESYYRQAAEDAGMFPSTKLTIHNK